MTNTYHQFTLYFEEKSIHAEGATELSIVKAREIFPRGFTTWIAEGFYNGIHENTRVVSVIVPAADADLARISVQELAKAINTLYNQESVLITESVVWGQFYAERF